MKNMLQKFSLLFILSSSSIASYAGTENYSGSECVRRSGGAVSYSFDGAVSNTSTTQASFVLCHVPHTDFDGFLNAGEIDGGWVDTVDLNPVAAVRCRFRGSSLNANGAIVRFTGAMGSSVGFGTQRRRLNLSGIGENANTSYVVACEIPPRTASGSSRVHGYQVRQ